MDIMDIIDIGSRNLVAEAAALSRTSWTRIDVYHLHLHQYP